MGSKETMVVAPALVVLWDHMFREDGRGRRWRPVYRRARGDAAVLLLPMLVGNAGADGGALRLLGYTAKAAGDTWTPWSYLWTQAGVITHYLALVVQAVAARVRLLRLAARALAARRAAAGAAGRRALVAVTVLAVVKRPAGFAGAVFFLTLAPTSSLLPIPTEVAAEHRMYLPLAAVIALTLTAAFGLISSRVAVARLRVGFAIVAFSSSSRPAA